MKSISSSLLAAALVVITVTTASDPAQPVNVAERGLKTLVIAGCFNSNTSLTFNNTDIYQSNGACQIRCAGANKAVQAQTNGDECWCGDTMPPFNSLVSNSSCNDPCAGYPADMCGTADGKFNVLITGVVDSSQVKYAKEVKDAPSTSTSTASTPTPTPSLSVTQIGGVAVTITATASVTQSPPPSSGGASKAGIAAGVVVGILALAGIGGAIFFVLRSRRRREVEDEYRKNAAANNFGSKAPSTSGSFQDARLDAAAMANRRMSDGSIADNQDYSRRILKVTNA